MYRISQPRKSPNIYIDIRPHGSRSLASDRYATYRIYARLQLLHLLASGMQIRCGWTSIYLHRGVLGYVAVLTHQPRFDLRHLLRTAPCQAL